MMETLETVDETGEPMAPDPVPQPDDAADGSPEDSDATDRSFDPAPAPEQPRIDRALGLRLKAQREKMERQHEPDRQLSRAVRSRYSGLTDPDILARMEAPPDSPAALAKRLLRESEALEREFPGFDPEEFVGSHGEAARLLKAGAPLRDVYRLCNLEGLLGEARAQGEREAAERIRARNHRLPSPTRSASGGPITLNVSQMSDEEFAAIEEWVRRGQRVRLDE
jgi:hypothetical protein